MKALPWLLVDNEIESIEKASISITDLGFNYGQGVFTTLYLEDGILYFYNEHKSRLRNWAYQLRMNMPEVSLTQLAYCINKNKALNGTFRIKIIISQGYDSVHSYVLVYPQDKEENQQLSTASFESCSHDPLSTMKTLSYMTSIYPRLFTQKEYGEFIRTDHEGHIIEGAVSNLFWYDGARLYYPDESLLYIHGVGINNIKRECELESIKCVPVLESVDQTSYEGTFFSVNNVHGPRPIYSLDSRDLDVNQDHTILMKELWSRAKNRSSMIISDLI